MKNGKFVCLIKKFLGKLRPSKIRKFLFVTKKLHPYLLAVKPELINNGFSKLKPFNKPTWKFYGDDKVRFTLLGEKDSKKFVIKVAKSFDEKMNNSIFFQLHFNDIFDFIPKGGEIIINGYKCYYTEWIDSVGLSSILKTIDNKQLISLLKQTNSLLDALNEYKIVHCDLEEVNILVEKSTSRLYLIDWDTICSSLLGLSCNAFPAYTIKKHSNNQIIFDDAYSFSILFKRHVDLAILNRTPLFLDLIKKIGRNEHVFVCK